MALLEPTELATTADLDKLEVRLTNELSSMKWMLGMVAAGMVALLIKAFF